MKKNVSGQVIGAQMCSAADGSNFTGAVTVYVTGDAGTQAIGAVGSGACTHEGNGFHTYAPSQAETNYDHVAFTFVGAGAISSTVQVYTTFPQTGDNFARLGTPSGASISADIAGIQSDTNDIQSRLPAALVGGRLDASVGAMAANTLTGSALAADAVSEIQAGLSTLDAAGVRLAVGMAAANLDVQLAAIDDYLDTEVAAIKAKTDLIPASPAAAGDIPSAASIADAVWDEALSGHLAGGSTGNALNAAGASGDPWSTSLPGAYSAGSAGYIVGTYVDAAISSSGGGLDAAGVRAALGLASANLDVQIGNLPTATENADALLNRDMGAVSDTNSRSPLNALRFIRNGFSISGATLTVLKEDDTTAAYTRDLTTDAAADPITGVS